MGDSTNTVYGHEGIRGPLFALLTMLVMSLRIFIMVTGTVAVLIIDIIIGAEGIGQILHFGITTDILGHNVSISADSIAFFVSAGTSAIQLAMWESILRKQTRARGTWIMAIILVFADTAIDLAVVGYLMTGHLQGVILPASQQPPLYWIVMLIFGLLSLCDSYYLVILMQHLRDKSSDSNPRNMFQSAKKSGGQLWGQAKTSWRPGSGGSGGS